jgi:hypothetical protein
VDALAGVVAVHLTSVPVAIVVLLTAVGAIAVVVHAIAGDLGGEVGPGRIGVVAVGVFGLAVPVAIARVETVAVLIDPVADQLQPVHRDGGILRGTVRGVRVAVAIHVRRAAVVHAVAVLVHAIARRVVSPVRAVVVVIVAVQRSRGAIAVLVVGSRTYAAERVGNSTIVGLAGIGLGLGHGPESSATSSAPGFSFAGAPHPWATTHERSMPARQVRAFMNISSPHRAA